MQLFDVNVLIDAKALEHPRALSCPKATALERIVIRQTLAVYGELLAERGRPAVEWVG